MKTNIQCLISSVVSAGLLLGLVGNARAQSVTTTTTLTSSANRSVFGQPVVFTREPNERARHGAFQFNATAATGTQLDFGYRDKWHGDMDNERLIVWDESNHSLLFRRNWL
jgi:hypothetical protein